MRNETKTEVDVVGAQKRLCVTLDEIVRTAHEKVVTARMNFESAKAELSRAMSAGQYDYRFDDPNEISSVFPELEAAVSETVAAVQKATADWQHAVSASRRERDRLETLLDWQRANRIALQLIAAKRREIVL